MDTAHFKKRLEEELETLEQELKEVADPQTDTDAVDPIDVADNIEELEEKGEEQVVLEARKLEVEAALARIDAGSFGKCRECGKEIGEERLEANPAANTCATHAA